LDAQAYYNLGNSLYRTGQLEPAIDAYKRALTIAPDDQDTKYNLEYVQRQMQEQEQKSDDSQDQDEQQDQEDQEDEQQDQSQDDQEQSDESQDQQGDQEEENPQDSESGEQYSDNQNPQPGDMSKEEAERLLNAFNQDEQEIQKDLGKQAQTKQRNLKKDW